jgi:hypothetical protein
MKQFWILALIGLGALPASGAAQRSQPLPQSRLSITPFVGGRSSFVDNRQVTLVLPGLVPLVVSFQGRGGGGTAGAEMDFRLFGPVGISGAFAITNPDDLLVIAQAREGAITQFEVDGPRVWFARAGISYRLPEPPPQTRDFHPAAYISVGPALVRQDYGGGTFDLPGSDNHVDSWAVNIAVKAVQRLGSPHLALHLGVEDYVTFWNPDDLEQRRIERFLALQPGTVLNADFDYDRSHIFLFHVGLAFRL